MSLSKPTVAIVGTCDTKLDAFLFLKSILDEECNAIIIDTGVYPPKSPSESQIYTRLNPVPPSSSNPTSRPTLTRSTTESLVKLLRDLHSRGEIAGVLGAGGSSNTNICTEAFREALPIGFPKVMVSTMASGDVSCYVRDSDITMMYSVVDIAGSMNRILERVLKNAARAVAGMALHYRPNREGEERRRPAVAVSMFGVTTPCVDMITSKLDGKGYEVVIFHATGSGGIAMERLIANGEFVGVVDLTTTELADELVGGVLSAGPNRLEAAAKAGIPQVVSVGALDMVNFGPRDSVPSKFVESGKRLLYEHNAAVTVMRTTKEECVELGKMMVRKLNAGDEEKTTVCLPLKGVSLLDVEGGPFEDIEAHEALFDELRGGLECRIVEVNVAINDEKFAETVVDELMKFT